MDDVSLLSSLLERRYGVGGVTLHPLVLAEEKSVFRVDWAGRPRWLLRVAPPNANPAGLLRDVTVLELLERHSYPAPRIVRTLDGAAIPADEHRFVFVTTFIDGEPIGFSPANLRPLGEALGRLHALPLPSPARPTTIEQTMIPPASMLPRQEIAAALSWLEEIRESASRAHRARYDELEAACHAIDSCEDLPQALIHNDCHPGNSILTANGRAVLIDWEGAGLGSAVIDVGFLLVSCEIDAFRPNRLPPDPERVNAVVDGYCRHHRLTAIELDRLANAMRFRSIVAAVSGFRRLIKAGLPDDPSGWAWARYTFAEEIAARARKRFERRA